MIVALRVDTTFGGTCQSAEIVDITGGNWITFDDGAVVCLAYTLVLEVTT